MKEAPALSPTDTAARALGLMHRHSLPGLVVIWEGRPVGIFSAEGLLGSEESPVAENWEGLPSLQVGEVMFPLSAAVSVEMPLWEVARLFREYAVSVLPAVDETGNYRGLVSRQEVIAGLCNIVHPGTLGGMATPLGVYLTNGAVRAGAGDFGLFLTGAFLALLWAFSSLLVNVICWAVQHWTSLPLLAMRDAFSSYLGVLYFGHAGLWTAAFFFVQMAGFFLLMRLLPLAGIHGAEHQVVHAIEQGEELTPEAVLSHTTVHPRCGTNLAAMMMVIGAGIYYFTMVRSVDPGSLVFYLLVVVIIALLLRQRIGGILQWLVTTRRPSQKQVVAAIRVGKELLERCRLHRGERGGVLERVWKMGLIQVLSGAGAASALLQIGQDYLEKWLL